MRGWVGGLMGRTGGGGGILRVSVLWPRRVYRVYRHGGFLSVYDKLEDPSGYKLWVWND